MLEEHSSPGGSNPYIFQKSEVRWECKAHRLPGILVPIPRFLKREILVKEGAESHDFCPYLRVTGPFIFFGKLTAKVKSDASSRE